MPKTFDSLPQRGIHYFLASMPPFRAVPSDAANETEQENAYRSIRGLYEKLYDDPGLLGLKILPDDCFPNWWTPKKEKPALTAQIRGYIKTINVFVEALYNIVSLGKADGDTIALAKGKVEIKPAMLKRFAGFGIAAANEGENLAFAFPDGTVRGLKLLAAISAGHASQSATAIHTQPVNAFTLFSHGVFDPAAPYTAEIFRGLFENKDAYDKLNAHMETNGFIRLDNKEYKVGLGGNPVSLDYVKFYGKPEGKIGDAWKTRNFSGIGMVYDEQTQACTTIGIHIPFFREILENANTMSDSLRGFMAQFNKCMGCRYCVQTDKSKTKPLRFMKVNDNNLCTYFTFGYTFDHFYNGMWLPDGAIELLEFVDKLFADRRVNL